MKTLRFLSIALIIAGVAFLSVGGAKLDMAQSIIGARPASASATLDSALKSGEIVRLHIIANDDTKTAQRIKLAVRDALIARYGAHLSALKDESAVLEFLGGELENIEAMADGVIKARGANYAARAELGESDFPDRIYDGALVPAGRYMALKLKLGRAAGRNWWCVIYPALCALPPDTDADASDMAARESAIAENGIAFHSVIWDFIRRALCV